MQLYAKCTQSVRKVYVDSILIFDGLFMLQEITESKYVGNLYRPVYKSVKDIFGDRVMNNPSSNSEKNKWLLNIEKADDIEKINQEVLSNINYENKSSNCLFPYILYGLIPKNPINPNLWVNGEEVGDFTPKDVYDRYAKLGWEDIPPAPNVLRTIEHIFNANDLNISGTAFEDDRLKHLYMSYSNPTDYIQEWNYGDLSNINITGSWSMADKNGTNYWNFERQISKNEDSYGKYYNIDLFNSNRSSFSKFEDSGSNYIYSEYKDKYADKDYTRKNLQITIPKSGFYKITLDSDIKLNNDGEHLRFWDDPVGNKFTSTRQSHSNRNNSFDRSMYEIQVLRDFGDGDFNGNNIVGHYNSPNFAQTSYDDKNQYPKYYPIASDAMVIDPKTNQNFINGLHFGRHDDDYNPKDDNIKANYMFIQNGFSYDNTFTQKKKILSIYDSANSYGGDDYNYWCFGTNDQGEDTSIGDDEIPNPIFYKVKKRKGIIKFLPWSNYTNTSNDINGYGRVQSIIWLEKGEHLTLNVVANMGDMRRGSSHHTEFDQWITLIDKVNFNLKIEAFRTDLQWDNFDSQGNYDPDRILRWNDESNFQRGYIDLCKFLPSEIKINDFIENFTKAFNLILTQPTKGNFRLDIKQTKSLGTSDIVSFENKFNIKLRSNEPLDLPSEINIKWNIDEEEEGYVSSNGYTGSGNFITGALGGSVTELSSIFSYNWYKNINFEDRVGVNNTNYEVPVISKHEAWENGKEDYAEMQKKWYTNLPIRFFYPNGFLYYPAEIKLGNYFIDLMKVTNTYDLTTNLVLDYNNKEYSILNNYFTIITTNETNYTVIETYLTPEEYELLDGRNLIKLNSDLYYVSAVDNYDPLMKNPAKIKLIRKL